MTTTHPEADTDLTTNRLPIFVYGTLRPGCGNDRLWEGRATALHDGEAVLSGFYMRTNGAFPYAIPSPDPEAIVVGALIVPTEGHYDDVLDRLDWLEGYPRHYDRVEVVVDLPPVEGDDWRSVLAWVYTPVEVDRLRDFPVIESGDWHDDRRQLADGRWVR